MTGEPHTRDGVVRSAATAPNEGETAMVREFKEFALKGNLIEIAVGLILALAFSAVVMSFVGDIVSPVIGAIVGANDLSALTIDVGDARIRYGAFLDAVISFLIVAFVLFLIVKAANRLVPRKPAETGPTEVELLTEIRDALRSGR
jgi:large conductance mechanosensitive channel